jgi:ElaB/YqjD/DUF883 family membrane-anchored ribosome-binding protein
MSRVEPPARSSDEIRADIERTRARLGDTVEALGAQLNPSHLKQRVKDSVREATIGRVQHMARQTQERVSETGRDLAHTIRENPIPAAMIAAGIGWLLIGRNRGRESRREFNYWRDNSVDEFPLSGDYDDEQRSAMGTGRGVAGRVASGAQQMAHGVADKASDLAERAQETGQRVAERARDATQRVSETARDATERVTETARDARQRVARQARSVAYRAEDQYDRNPIAVGAFAVAMGMAVGFSLPTTDKEAELMGEKRDELMEKARDKIAETRDKVENVVDRAAPDVKAVIRDAAREEGLTG